MSSFILAFLTGAQDVRMPLGPACQTLAKLVESFDQMESMFNKENAA